MNTLKLLVCAIIVTGAVSVSHGALNAYLTLTGETQGDINGDSSAAGHEGSIEVISFHHEVVSPRDAASGLPTGKRSHTPVKISKRIDKATPLIFQALDSGERMSTFRLDFVRNNPSLHTLEDYYSVELMGARIAGIRQTKMNTLDSANDWAQDMETVWFTYERINWTYRESAPIEGIIESQSLWDFEPGEVPRISDMNYDGNIDLLDLAVLAEEYLEQ